MPEKNSSMEELRWVRLFSPVAVPKSLIEQIKDREYPVEDFYKFHEINCLHQTDSGPTLNPFHHLYGLVDPDNLIQGILWFVIDPLTKDMVINTFSVEHSYWAGRKSMERLINHIKEIKKKLKIKKIFWMTRYPRHSERYGFKRSRQILMEYTGEEDGKVVFGGSVERGECEHADSGATTTLQPAHNTSGPSVHVVAAGSS